MDKQPVVSNNDRINELRHGYITGFFDAEGTVTILKDHMMQTFITQSYLPVLEFVNRLFPATIRVHLKAGINKDGVNCKNAWRWRIDSDNAIPFLEYVNKYSIEKKHQIELALKYQKEIKRTRNKNERMQKVSQTEIEARDWFVKELQRIKHECCNSIQSKNYDNEIKKLKIPKDIRSGRQSTIIPLEDIYKEKGINIDEVESVNIQKCAISDMSKDIEIGYLTGFFDGEGYIGIMKGKRDSYQLSVANSNSNFDILKLYEQKFGGEIRPVLDSKNKKNFQWNIRNDEASIFLKTIEKLTIVKRKQIQYAIEFQQWHDSIRIIKTLEHKRKAEWYYQKLRDIKKETE